MSLKWAALAIAVLGLGIASYGIWRQLESPPRVLSTGNILVEDGPGKRRLLTRSMAIGRNVVMEVELPNGTWIDCGGDCPDAARKATVGFWDEQRKNRR